MLRVSGVIFCLLVLTACNPFEHQAGDNQFVLKKNTLSFDGHKLATWQEQKIPYCQLCSFNIYSKKMSPVSQLFKQVNNERGDLIFLAASNLRYSFALQTGGQTYPMRIAKYEDSFVLKVDSERTFTLRLNQTQLLSLGTDNYHFSLQKVNKKQDSVDLIFWLAKPL